MRKLNFQLLVMLNEHECAKSRERKYMENKSDNIGFHRLQMVKKIVIRPDCFENEGE